MLKHQLILEERITIVKFLMDRNSDNNVSNRLANGALYMLQITAVKKARFRNGRNQRSVWSPLTESKFKSAYSSPKSELSRKVTSLNTSLQSNLGYKSVLKTSPVPRCHCSTF
jgi:hypothetical protein